MLTPANPTRQARSVPGARSARPTPRPLTAAPPASLPERGRLQRKCACGGTCPHCQGEPHLQPKLAINQPGDAFEQEADRIADKVMRMPDPQPQPAPASPSVQRACAACEEEEERSELRTKRLSSNVSAANATAPPIVHEVLRSAGQPLDVRTRAFMEPRFGRDFSDVRVHMDVNAAESARAVNALAYTVGRDVVFAAGRYAPQTTMGQRLLAHELTHVMQQRSAGDTTLRRVEGPCEDIPETLPHPFLVRGSVAPPVREAQVKLNLFHEQQIAAGKPGLDDAPLVPDCIFGQHTLAAVLSFQKIVFPSNPDFHTGNIGEHTWAELDKATPCRFVVEDKPFSDSDCTTRLGKCGGGQIIQWTRVKAVGSGCPSDLSGKNLTEKVDEISNDCSTGAGLTTGVDCLTDASGKLTFRAGGDCVDEYSRCFNFSELCKAVGLTDPFTCRDLLAISGCTQKVKQHVLLDGVEIKTRDITIKIFISPGSSLDPSSDQFVACSALVSFTP